MNRIYTAGYSGHTPAQLKQAAEALDAIVVDIRYAPYSRMPGWAGKDLEALLGNRYTWLRQLGNRAYNQGRIEIANLGGGMVQLGRMAKEHSLILLCGCADYNKCHRAHVADMLRHGGWDVQEIEWPESTSPGTIKAISLWQPWSWLCVAVNDDGRAEKEYETRSWATSYRGLLVIHAAKKWDAENAYTIQQLEFQTVLRRHFTEPVSVREALGFGAAIGIVKMVDCIETYKIREQVSQQERDFGDFGHGRFAWKFVNPRKFKEPISMRGAQGLFNVDLPDELL